MSAAPDTNVLLYASDKGSPFHVRAVQFLAERARSRDLLYLAWPTVIGYLRIATHPGIFLHPLSAAEATRNVNTLLSLPHVRLLAADEGVWEVYQDAVRDRPARGNQIPDAHLAALLHQHGVGTRYKGDADFRRFDFRRVVNPFA